MKIICAPDKFKESLTAPQAALAIGRGVKRACPEAQIEQCPIADGGDGTVEALVSATGGVKMSSSVSGPMGEPVAAAWGLLGRPIDAGDATPVTAVIEMATASGLALVKPDARDVLKASTYGTGQLIVQAMNAGATHIILGIGGSATNDAGCGALQAMGARFYDPSDKLIDTPMSGGLLEHVGRIDLTGLHLQAARTTFIVACDVTNLLAGPDGAAFVYGPQKGASPDQVRTLDAGLKHIASLWRMQLGMDVADTPGSGAAGGFGGGLVAMLGATLKPGVTLVLDAVDFARRASGATICFTGEGRLDGQSLSGKACLGVANAAKAQGVDRVIALVGSVASDAPLTLQAGLDAYHVIGPGLSKEESMRRAAELLEQAAFDVMQAWKAGV